jgi:hypothetical protein
MMVRRYTQDETADLLMRLTDAYAATKAQDFALVQEARYAISSLRSATLKVHGKGTATLQIECR